jgi:hypothetical protein
MFMNEYVTKFTQLSCYAPHEVNTDEKKQECFLNGLNDGLVYALEARDFENFQGMVNKALVIENHRGVMERKHKLVHQHSRVVAPSPELLHPQLHLPLPVEPILFLLLPSRTTPVGESIMWLWKKHKKLLILSLVCFSSMTLLE